MKGASGLAGDFSIGSRNEVLLGKEKDAPGVARETAPDA
jgi:hypothetical protein